MSSLWVPSRVYNRGGAKEVSGWFVVVVYVSFFPWFSPSPSRGPPVFRLPYATIGRGVQIE